MSRGNLESRYRPFTVTRSSSDGWSTTTTSFAGRGFIQSAGGRDTYAHYKLDEKVEAVLYCPVSTSLKYGDVVTQAGESWSVAHAKGQVGGISGTGHHKEVLLSAYGGNINA